MLLHLLPGEADRVAHEVGVDIADIRAGIDGESHSQAVAAVHRGPGRCGRSRKTRLHFMPRMLLPCLMLEPRHPRFK